jgi:hypothetical protein
VQKVACDAAMLGLAQDAVPLAPAKDALARHRHPVTVFHGDMAPIRQLRLATRRIAIQPAVRIRGALERVIFAGICPWKFGMFEPSWSTRVSDSDGDR